MKKWYDPRTWFKAEPLPIQINPASADMLARHAGRLARLYAVQSKKHNKQDVSGEIEQRKKAIEDHGHKAPANEQEALALLLRTKG